MRRFRIDHAGKWVNGAIMQADGAYRDELIQELAEALLAEGLHHPETVTEHLKRENFEESFLETRLRALCGEWEDGILSQWDFQKRSLTINGMLEEMENDPQRYSGWRKRYRATLDSR